MTGVTLDIINEVHREWIHVSSIPKYNKVYKREVERNMQYTWVK